MPDVISLEEAKSHLRITSVHDDQDIRDKLVAATQVIIDYLSRSDTAWNDEMDAWTTATIPASVRAAILVQLGELYRKRGDDSETEPDHPTRLSTTVMALLMRYRDPGIA